MARAQNRNRRSVIVWLIASFLFISMLTVFWQADQVLGEFEIEATHLTERLQTDIDNTVHSGSEDLVFLVESPEARAVASGDSDAIRELGALFLAYAGARARVFQVRLLGADGQELLRVERAVDLLPRLVTQLQNKGQRYYFTQASTLERGEVLVSELDLNVENGAIELPLRPTLRFATPLLDDAGKLRGVIVVNRSGQDLIDLVKRSRGQLPGSLLLIDSQGNYLSHPDSHKEWGGSHMLNSGEDLAREHADVWAWYRAQGGQSTLRSRDLIAARAVEPSSSPAPSVLLLASINEAVVHRARDFVPLILGLIAAAIVVIVSLVSWTRQQELAQQVEREAALRRQVASREENLREAQGRLVASARLAALTESAAALAHELRNPLGAIINSVALLKSEPTMEASDRALLGVVLSESQRLERAVSEFLDLSRRPRRRIERFDLNDTVRQVVTLAEQDLGPDIELKVDLASETLQLDADPDEVRQILWNLLLNARTANRRAGGRIIFVKTGKNEHGEKLGVCLEVADEGLGLNNDEPAASDVSGTQGAGLGLIVVAGITAHYSGHFEIRDRTEARGASAQVWLPFGATEIPWQPS